MNEHKILNVVMYFVTVIVVWVAAVVFYFVCLQDLACGDNLALLIIIGLGVFTVSALFYLLEVFTAYEHDILSIVFFFIGYIIQIAGVVALCVLFDSEKYNASFVSDTPYWILSVCSVLPVIGLIMFDVIPKYASVMSALIPVISVVVAAGFCTMCYFLVGVIVARWELPFSVSSTYFLAPTLAIAIITTAWTLLRFVCKLIVKLGS